MNGMRLLRLGLFLVAMLTLAACVGTRSDFPAWMFPHPPQVSSEAGSNESDMPAIFSDSGDNVIVAWSSDPAESGHSDTEIYWRRYNPIGTPQTPPVRLTHNGFGDLYPSVGMSEGITYLVWMGDEITSSNIYWAAVDQDGNILEGPEMISDPTYNDYDPHLIQCGDYSHVYWSGDSASYDFEIYYAKIRYNGITDVPYKRVTNLTKPERSPHGEVDMMCTQLFIAYEYQYSYSPPDSDVLLVGIDTGNGNNIFGPTTLAGTNNDEKDIDIAVDSPFLGSTLVSVVWTSNDSAGREIQYASRHSNGTVCAATTDLTNDSQLDERPVVENAEWNGNKYALVFWERVAPATGTDRDIYASSFIDNCNPSPPSSPTLISESTASETADDVNPLVLARLAPDGAPIFVAIWRTESDGAVWSRFGSIFGPIGASDLISDAASAGYPEPAIQRPAPVAALGNQVFVTWLGNNLGTTETWYQQTAWRSSLPIVAK